VCNLFEFFNKMVRSRSLDQVVEQLPSKSEVLSSNHSITTHTQKRFHLLSKNREKIIISLQMLIKGDI
jgi:hypothetical protein